MEQAIWMCGVVGISIDQFDGWFNGHPDQFIALAERYRD